MEKNIWKTPVKSWTKKDFKIDWFSGTGAGGQFRNKNQNSCRITHIKTGITATCQNHRERTSNQRDAFKTLARRLLAYYAVEDNRDEHKSNERIRTYHKERNVVTDHASGLTLPYKYVVMDAHLDEMIEARRKNIIDKQIGE